MTDCGVQIVKFGVEIAEIVVRLAKARIDGQRPLIAADRLVTTTGDLQSAAKIEVCLGEAGIDSKGPPIFFNCIIESIDPTQGVAETLMRQRRSRLEREFRLRAR